MSSELDITKEWLNDELKICISGEVDIYTAEKFKQQMYDAVDSSKSDLNVDCENLNYIDSTGLGIFVGALKKAKQQGKSICILNPKENIKKLFAITGLDKLFKIE